MDIFKYTLKSEAETIKEFNSSSTTGLSSKTAKELQKQHGKNVLINGELSWWKILLRQFKSAFIYLLIFAAIIALGLGEIIEGLMIMLFLLINAGLGFFQEYRSEKTAQLLKKYIISYVKILRDGKKIILKSEELIPGDIIFLETGDKIPADVRFLSLESLSVDESILTGETIPVNKTTASLKKLAIDYYQASNLGFSGTSIINGKAKAIVISSGAKTAVGKIAKLSTETKRISNFEKGIAKFSNFILKLVIFTLLIVFLVNVLIKGDSLNIVEMIIFSIALTVSVIPEALPLVTTFSLSRGAMNLAKKKIIVKRLSAIEDLGSIEVLCTDKTGTLTQNKLSVADVYSSSQNHEAILFCANLASAFDQEKKLEPFDIALWDKLTKTQQKDILTYTKINENTFDPKIKRNIVLVGQNKKHTIITRGAYESIMPLCQNLSTKNKKDIEAWIETEGKLGHRTMAIAQKADGKATTKLDQQTNFTFLGLISFVDSIKQSAYQIAKQAKILGVDIKIITGDSKDVAVAVAYKFGLTASPDEVITAEELDKLSPLKRVEALEKYAVFARVSPEQKYAIIETLQLNHEVGFLGEGINDAPVLKIAGVSIVVDSASDIAKEAADILLLQKDLKVILDGISEGRKIFANTTKYIKTTLVSNFGNFFAVAAASLMIDFLPMLPLQILLVNLLSDFPMIAIATDSVDDSELKSPKKYEINNIIIFSIVLGLLSMIFDFIFFGLFYKISPSVLQTNWFIGSILTELVLIFSIRTKSFFPTSKKPSGILSSLAVLAAVVTLAVPFTSWGQEVFKFTAPSLNHLAIILVIVIVYFIGTEALKLFFTYKFKEINHKNKLATT